MDMTTAKNLFATAEIILARQRRKPAQPQP